jgi:hypothetical protein
MMLKFIIIVQKNTYFDFNVRERSKKESANHKVLTYIEYRAVSGVFRTIGPHHLSTQRECPPPHQRRGGTHSPGGEGGGFRGSLNEDERVFNPLCYWVCFYIKMSSPSIT